MLKVKKNYSKRGANHKKTIMIIETIAKQACFYLISDIDASALHLSSIYNNQIKP